MFASYTYDYEEVTVRDGLDYLSSNVRKSNNHIEGDLENVSRIKRKHKYIPGMSKPLFHSTIRGSTNERVDIFDEEYNWWKYTSRRSSDFLRNKEYEESTTAGEDAVFECEVEGVDNINWLKDNRPLSDRLADRITTRHEGNLYRLEIRNVCEDDSGTYTARAENDCGVSMSTAHLIVENLSEEEKRARHRSTSPVFLVHLKDSELLESTHARFVVKVIGNPMPDVQFYKGDRRITDKDDHIEIVRDKAELGFYEMVIQEVRPEDAGEYICIASNKYSEKSCSCVVTVTNEKDIFAGLQNDLSSGEPTFSWLKNGKPFSPEERFKVIYKDEEDSIALVFRNVRPEDAGLYTCVASTTHGRISCSAELTVQGTINEIRKTSKKAKLHCWKTEFEGDVGSSTALEVKVTGDPLPKVKWLKNGEEIRASAHHKTFHNEVNEIASLVINNVCVEDGGEYTVITENEAGSDSQVITLKARAAAKITKNLEDFTGLIGEELKMTIQVEGSPKPIIQWYKDGIPIKTSHRIKCVCDKSSDSYTLLVDNAAKEDAGMYSVVVSNECSQVSDACHVSVAGPPKFLKTFASKVETTEGDSLTFSVTVEDSPLSILKWKFNDEEIIDDNGRFKMNSDGNLFTLHIDRIKIEDEGSYSCEISNQWGSNICNGHLLVRCRPTFVNEMRELKVNEDETDVAFTVKISACPKAKITWYKDEIEITSKKREFTCIEDGDTYQLIIKQATTEMSGVYKCRAENDVGARESSASLIVYTVPKFKKILSDIEISEGDTLHLTVECEGIPEPDIKWYRNGKQIYSDSRIKITRDAKRIENYSLTITLIQKEDGGEYEVRATNERGTAVIKSLVTVLARTDHKKWAEDEMEEPVVQNGFDDDDKSTDKLQNASQVKNSVTIKLPAKKKSTTGEQIKKQNAISTDRKKPTRSRLSTESADEEGFTVRELRTEEFTATTEMKASSFGVVEEPPENEHYIKININRGVSIVSVSEDDNLDEQNCNTFEDVSMSYKKKTASTSEFNEEDELILNLNDSIKLSPSSTNSELFLKHARMSDKIMNQINKSISSLENENDASVISYNSTRKSSIVEEFECVLPQKGGLGKKDNIITEEVAVERKKSVEDLKPPLKAVSFDELPTQICESDDTDESVDQLFKRIQTQRSILGEIMEKQQESGETRKSSLKQSPQMLLPEQNLDIEKPKLDNEEKTVSTEFNEQSRGASQENIDTHKTPEEFSEIRSRTTSRQSSQSTEINKSNIVSEQSSITSKLSERGSLSTSVSSSTNTINVLLSENFVENKFPQQPLETSLNNISSMYSFVSQLDEPIETSIGDTLPKHPLNVDLVYLVSHQASIDTSNTPSRDAYRQISESNDAQELNYSHLIPQQPEAYLPTGIDDESVGNRPSHSSRGISQLSLTASQSNVHKPHEATVKNLEKGVKLSSRQFSELHEFPDATQRDIQCKKLSPPSSLNANRLESIDDYKTVKLDIESDTEKAGSCRVSQQRPVISQKIDQTERGNRRDSLIQEQSTMADSKQLNIVKSFSKLDFWDVPSGKLADTPKNPASGEINTIVPMRVYDEEILGADKPLPSEGTSQLQKASKLNSYNEETIDTTDTSTPQSRQTSRLNSLKQESIYSNNAFTLKQESIDLCDSIVQEMIDQDDTSTPQSKQKSRLNLLKQESEDIIQSPKQQSVDVSDISTPQSRMASRLNSLKEETMNISLPKRESLDVNDRTSHSEQASRQNYLEIETRDLNDSSTVPFRQASRQNSLKLKSENLNDSSNPQSRKISRIDSQKEENKDLSDVNITQSRQRSRLNSLKNESVSADKSPNQEKINNDFRTPQSRRESRLNFLKQETEDIHCLKQEIMDISDISISQSRQSIRMASLELQGVDVTGPSNLKQDSVNDGDISKPQLRQASSLNSLKQETSNMNDVCTPQSMQKSRLNSLKLEIGNLSGLSKQESIVESDIATSQSRRASMLNSLKQGSEDLNDTSTLKSIQASRMDSLKQKNVNMSDIHTPQSKQASRLNSLNQESVDLSKFMPQLEETHKFSQDNVTNLLKQDSVNTSDDITDNKSFPQRSSRLTSLKFMDNIETQKSELKKMVSGTSMDEPKGAGVTTSTQIPNVSATNSVEEAETTSVNIEKKPVQRSSTLESVFDISFNGDKDVKNKRGSLDSATIKKPRESPQILSGMESDVNAYKSSAATFEVVAHGVPRPNITWYKDNKEITASKHFVVSENGDKYKLEIMDLKSSDAGVYTAKLTNCAGEKSRGAKLLVSKSDAKAPELKEGIKAKTIPRKQTAILEATFIADSVPEAVWTVNEKEVKAEFSVDVADIDSGLKECTYRMTIPSSELSNTGLYTVKVKNEFGTAESSNSLTIVMVPVIESLHDVFVHVTKPSTFEAIIVSNPEAEVTWYYDGKKISSNKKHAISSEKFDEYKTIHCLAIEDCSLTDEGNYKAEAANYVGKSDASATLTLHKPPEILSGMEKDIEVFEASTAVFEVVAGGVPRPDITWYKDDKELAASKHFVIAEEGDKYKLEIVDVEASDAGVYKVNLSNSAGEKSKEAKLSLSRNKELAPKLKEGIKAKTVPKGRNATLEATFISDSMLDAAWTVNGKEVDAKFSVDTVNIELGLKECTYRMTIPFSDLSDTGTYTVKVKNKFGSAESSNSLTVVLEPIIEVFKDVVAPLTMPCTFEAIVKANPEAEICWYTNSQEITSCTKYSITNENIDEYRTVYRLKIDNCSLTDEGIYKVKAANSVGKSEASASLTFYQSADILSGMEKDVDAFESSTAVFEIVGHGFPRPNITWYKDGKELTSCNHFIISEDGNKYKLEIVNLEASDAGVYKVKLSNSAGDKSKNAKLLVSKGNKELAPKLKEGIKATTVTKGEKATLEAILIVDSVLDAVWTVNGKEVDAKFSVDTVDIKSGLKECTYKMIIPCSDLSNTGIYKIEVKNKFGSAESTNSLTVIMEPIIEVFNDVVVPLTMSCTFEATVMASPEAEITWYVNGKIISSCTKYMISHENIGEYRTVYRLKIDGCSMTDEGNYKMKVANCIGEAEANASLTLYQSPEILSGMEKEIDAFEASTPVFEVVGHGVPRPIITWYKDGKELTASKHFIMSEDGDRYILEITDVKASDAGVYKAKLSNSAGEKSKDTNLLISKGDRERAPKLIEGIKAKIVPRGEMANLEATFIADSVLDADWTVNGREVDAVFSFDVVDIESGLKESTYKMTIPSCDLSDTGMYTVKVKNKFGSAESSNTLKIVMEPVIEVFKDVVVPLTMSCTFEATVMATPKAEIIWYVNGKEISSCTKYTISNENIGEYRTVYRLKIDDCSMTDEGNYKVKAANSVGESEASATLILHQSPEIYSGMEKDIEAFELSKVLFEVVGHGVPRPNITWYKDGKELTASKHFVLSEDGNAYKLEIMDLKTTDAGVYTAQLTNNVGETSRGVKLLVTKSDKEHGPKLKEGLQAQTIIRQKTMTMEAKFIADSVPDAVWTVNGRNVNAEFSVDVIDIETGLKECAYRITIPSCDFADAGTYTVKVKNKFGSAESSNSLTVVMEPVIEIFKDVVVPLNMSCIFEATIMSSPEAKVTWYINEKKISSSVKYKILSEKIGEFRNFHRLIIEDCSLTDEGVYKVEAENFVGKSDAIAALKLYTEKPSFVKPLEDVAIQYYRQVQMTVQVNGVPKPDIKWYRNGEEMSSDNHMRIDTNAEGQLFSTLTIENFTADDVAQFKVIATNIVGETETSSKLTLAQIEPLFAEPLKPVIEVSESEPLSLITKATGSPIPAVQWFKDGEEIKPDDERIKTSASPNGFWELNIDEVIPSDEGTYKAVAINDSGKTITETAVHVTEALKKPNFIKELEDVSVMEGEPIKFDVQIDGFPKPTIKWIKDGQTVQPNLQMQLTSGSNNTHALTIDKATLLDIGLYSVIISNRLGEECSTCQVKITPTSKAPEFQIPLESAAIMEGYPVKLEVKVHGFPEPKLDWSLNGVPLKIDSDNIKLGKTPEGNDCLLIGKVKPENAGVYQVCAKNDIGEKSTKARLSVTPRSISEVDHEKPAFLRSLRDVIIDESKDLSISAPFRGNPIPDVQWFKDGKLLHPNERIHFICEDCKVGLEIRDVNMADQGFYACAVKNPYGEDSTAGHVGVRKLYQAPVFTQRFNHQRQLPNQDAKFHSRVIGLPFPSIVWYRNGVSISNSEKYQIKRDEDVCCLTILNVGKEDEAKYGCIASNREGTASCEAQLQVLKKFDSTSKSEPPYFLKKINNCNIYPGMVAKYTACADGYPEPEYEWFCDGKRLQSSDRVIMEQEGTGLVRLKIIGANPKMDAGRYRLRAFNPHGEAFCEANIFFDSGLQSKHRNSVTELSPDIDGYRLAGVPLPISDKPFIRSMTDRRITLSWKPSIPVGPREPVTYLVEMEEQPNGKWQTSRSGLRGNICDINNLRPFVDYKFRVRVENKYGISEPSPYAITHRQKLEPDLPKRRTYLPSNEKFHPDTCLYFPKDFDVERPPHDNYAQAPKFLRQEYDTQYGVKGHNVNLFWFVYGYPKPTISYYFNGELIETGGRYDCSYTRNGQASLFVNKMMDRDVGVYEAVAINEHGTARQTVQLKIAEYPVFLKRPEEIWVHIRKTCKLEARVIGVPYPEIKWYKDWKPLASSSRIQIEQTEPDICILRITDVMMKDEGLYSISARNIAGSISTSVYMHVVESDHDIVEWKYSNVSSKKKKLYDHYDYGDELGRGTQGIVLHAVERDTGKNLAAKVMHGTGETRKWMTNELDIMNQLKHKNIIRPYDSFITDKSYTIVQELASGGELLEVLTRKNFITEYEISHYIRQLLLALDHMHGSNIAHLGLTPGDLLISHPGSEVLKISDFGLSRRINDHTLEPLHFGMPEFVAPEVAKGDGVSLWSDMWSVGVITHLLLTGISLFRGMHDADTLDRIKEGRFSLATDISTDARDFIIKLLLINPKDRINVREALNHKWIRMSGPDSKPPEHQRQINTENHRNYYNFYRDWYSNANCKTWFKRKPLESAYKDSSHMLYPPGQLFRSAPSTELQPYKYTSQYKAWKDRIPSREHTDIDIGLVKSESHYQYGPDTYLLQLRDVDFPCRLREYMKVAKRNTQEGFDWKVPVIRERRKFTDVMDEEIDDERKARINLYGSSDVYSLRRLRQETGSRPTAHVEAEAILSTKIDGLPPFFREKPQILPVVVGNSAEFVCYAVGCPKPIVQWFRNDLVLTESNRVKITEDEVGRSILRLSPAFEYDLGIYKVVARNKFGQTVARTRLVRASVPSSPEAPEIMAVSDNQILLQWKQLRDDGNSSVICYGLQYQENGHEEWKSVAQNIDHEGWLVHDLSPEVKYQFRLLAMNKVGWSSPGLNSVKVKTRPPGAEKIVVPRVFNAMQYDCENNAENFNDIPKTKPDYNLECQFIEWAQEPPQDKYRFISEIARGKFSVIVKAVDFNTNNKVVAKLVEVNAATEPEINRKFEIFRTLRHERIVSLIEAFKLQSPSVAIFVMEKLQGADVLTYLSSRYTYTEQMVANVVTQVLDGLQYLHWKGYCHFNIQPDNVVMASVRSLQVKLVDFSCAQQVHRLGTLVKNKGSLEYSAPEILSDELAYPFSDIWSVGVFTYILLSGVSPFRGYTEMETRQNITFVRYRFEYLYKDLSQEATRFIMSIFKRTPTKRPSAEECHEHRWLLPTEYMIKKRERNCFDTTKLKAFSDEYHTKRNSEATSSSEILSVLGGKVTKSNSIVDELNIMNLRMKYRECVRQED